MTRALRWLFAPSDGPPALWPRWIWLRPAARLVSTAIILWIVESVVKIYPLFIVVAKGSKDAARYANLEFFVNQSCWWSLMVFAISLWTVRA